MLALSFAANGYQITKECLVYKSNAISHINQSITHAADSSISRVVGAILLLIGVEVRAEGHISRYLRLTYTYSGGLGRSLKLKFTLTA